MRPRFQFSTVTRIEDAQWRRASVLAGSHAPGTLFLTGAPGMCGGLLKLDRSEFLLLSRAQVYLQAWAQWPGSPVRFRIMGDRAEFDLSELKKRAEALSHAPEVKE